MGYVFSKIDNSESILRRVERPSRYIGGEWNARRFSNDTVEHESILADICLCYPDLYEIGSSAPGLGVLYSVVNSTKKFSAQRCYAPKEDFFNEIKKNGIGLFSLETKKPLVDFDAVGFTLQHELSLTNVLYMLDSGGIPFRSEERFSSDKKYPLVIGGGPLTLNPEPFADFFDLLVVGDGEEAIVEVMEIIASSKRDGVNGKESRYNLLKKIAANVSGVYAPSFYEPVYDARGFYRGLKRREPSCPEIITKRIYDIRKSPSHFYDSPVVPNPASAQARLVIEIARGCPHKCAFCSASVYYSPWRVRNKEEILAMVKQGLKNTGYDEVSFASLSSGDYPLLVDLLRDAVLQNTLYPLALAIPSIHCEKFSPALASTLADCSASRPSLTFAPETGTECLRFSVGKKLSDENILAAVRAASSAGWRQAKFYFMYGLPNETQEDIIGIIELVKTLRKNFRDFGVKVSLSPFIPKAHTAFEREKFEDIESLKSKFLFIRKHLGGAAETHRVDGSFIEALIARGDRRLSHVIEKAYRNGAKFDQWRENFLYDKWIEAFQSEGIDPFKYVNRFKDEPSLALPWSHISVDWQKNAVAKSCAHESFSDESSAANVGVGGISLSCGGCVNTSEDLDKKKTLAKNQRPVRFRIRMSRTGLAKFISNNDQIEIIRRSARRARLPLVYSKGFHPQPKISFGPAISVGYESRAEYFEVELARYIAPQEITDRLNSSLPEGYKILSTKQVPTTFASFESLCSAVEYSIRVIDRNGEHLLRADNERIYEDFINEFLSLADSFIETEDGRRLDIRMLVRSVTIVKEDHEESSAPVFFLRITLNIIPGKNVKVEKIAKQILRLTGDEYIFEVIREKFFAIRKKDNTIFEI